MLTPALVNTFHLQPGTYYLPSHHYCRSFTARYTARSATLHSSIRILDKGRDPTFLPGDLPPRARVVSALVLGSSHIDVSLMGSY